MTTYTREELTNLTLEQFNALSQEEQDDVRSQGKAFQAADLGDLA
jgi:hypothetical protein